MNLKSRNTTASIFTMLLLASLVVLSAICFLTGFLFLWQDKANAWVPLIFGLIVFSSAAAGWFFAQKDADIEESESESKPTTVWADNQGNRIVMDTRALESPLAVQNLGTLLKLMSEREPRPSPDEISGETADEITADEISDEISDEPETPVPSPVEEVHQSEAATIHAP